MGGAMRVEIQPTISGPDAPVKQAAPSAEQPVAPQQGEAPKKPDWCPDKFWDGKQVNAEGLAKSYVEIEKSKSKPAVAKPGDAPVEKPSGEQTPKAEDGTKKPEEKPAEKPAETSIPGVTQEASQKYWGELTEGGKLSEDSYTELAKAGYPKHLVDVYIKGIQADQQAQTRQADEYMSVAGGKDGYNVMADWMANNLAEADLTEYNQAVNSGNPAVIKHAISTMHARYQENMGGEEPKLLGGKPTGNLGEVFKSNAEVKAAMKDPRYKKDSAYRAEVMAKMSRSKI